MYDHQPHGMPGKAYALPFAVLLFILGSIVFDAIAVVVISAPLEVVLIVGPVIMLAFFGFAGWLTQARGGEG